MSDLVERLRRPVFDSEEWYSALEAAFKMRDAGHRDSCARDLMDSYVDEAATERTEAADEIERLSAEVARLTKENDWLRAYTGQSAKACIYCGLGADEQGKCNRGFPGCARADDQMLCREVDVAMERDALLARVEAAEHDLMDGAMLIRRLSRQLAKAVPSALAPRNAMDWLTRRPWFKASPLRDDAAMEGGK